MRTTIAILLVACCLLGWWTLGPDATLPPPTQNDKSNEVKATTAAGPVPGASTGTIDATANREDVVVVDEDHNSLAPELPDDAKWVDVRIVMRETGEAVANAEVVWINQLTHISVGKLPRHKRPDPRNHDELVKTYGWRTRSDSEGIIRIVPGKSRAEVIATKDGLYGRGSYSNDAPPREGHKLEIEPDLTLRVRVWTADRLPAHGVPLATTKHDPTKTRQPFYWWWNSPDAETDRDGYAAFAHMQLQQRQGGGKDEKPVAQWLVHVRSPGMNVEPVAVDAQSPPSEPVEIELPATGHLRVRMLSGQEALAQHDIMVWQVPENGSKVPSYMSRNQAIRKVTDQDGWIEHRHVGLHKAFHVGEYAWKTEVNGPVQAGTTATATVNLDAHAVVLAGRLLTRNNEPLASQRCTLKFHNDKGVMDQSAVFTEADGTFLHVMSPGEKDKPRDRVRLEFRWDPQDGEGETIELAARVLHVGRTELGDIQLRGAKLIVAGSIIPSCKIESQCHLQIQKMHPPGRDGKPNWSWLQGVNVNVDAELHFAAYGSIEPGRYRLQVFHADFAPAEPVEFTVGARDLRIERQCGNTLAVRCLLPEPLDGTRVQLQLVELPGNKQTGRMRHRSSDPGVADYSWKGLADGTYALEIRPSSWGQTAPLHRIEGIQLPMNGNREGSLADIDLRDMIATLELEIAFANGKENTAFVFAMPQPNDLWAAVGVQAGKTTIPVAAGTQELLIAAWNHEPITLQATSGHASATLQPRPQTNVQVVGIEQLASDYRVTLYAKPAVTPPKDSRKFRAGWGNNDLSSLLQGSDTSTRLKDGMGSLALGNGSYRLELLLRHNKTRRSTRLKSLTPSEVVSGSAYQVQVDANELAAAIAELATPRKPKKK